MVLVCFVLLDYFYGALGGAFAAVGTLLIINDRQVIVHVDGVELALFCAQGAADAAVVAFGFYVFALIMRRTLNQMLCIIWNQFDQVVWTCSHAFAAGYAFFFVYYGYAVYHMNGVEGAGFYAGSVSHTAVGAGLLSGSWDYGYFLAVVHTEVIVLDSGLVAGSFTFDEGYLLYCAAAFHAHDGSDLVGHGSAAYGAGVNRSGSGSDGVGQAVTAREAAAAAVVAGQLRPD